MNAPGLAPGSTSGPAPGEPAAPSTPLQPRRLGRLWHYVLGAALNALVLYLIPSPGYDQTVHLLLMVVLLAIALLSTVVRGHVVLGNLALGGGLLLILYVTLQTGGINSPAQIWLCAMTVPVLLLLGRRWGLLWLGLVLTVMLLEFLAVKNGWISGAVPESPPGVGWAFLVRALVIVNLMVMVHAYDRNQRKQVQVVAHGNAEREATQKALLQAQAHKDAFVASVSHELRTPMNAILGLNPSLLQALADRPEDADIARQIGHSTRELLQLVNNILDFSRLQAGQFSLLEQAVSLEQAIGQVLQAHTPDAQAKGLTLSLHLDAWTPAVVRLDGLLLAQLLGHLLDNAIKFSTQGVIELRVQVHHGMLRIEVHDTGPGLTPAHQARLFNRFDFTTDAHTLRPHGGVGLGLAICEHLARLQGGRIGAHNRPDRGSCFWVELPLHAVDVAPASAPVPQEAREPGPLRVLLVDDNAVNLMVARLAIEQAWPQAQVSTANSGEQALQQLDALPVDLVLMDLQMPGLDGLQTTTRLRAHPQAALAQLPVMGLTASTDPSERDRARQAGMNDLLLKPLQTAELQAALERLRLSPARAARGGTA